LTTNFIYATVTFDSAVTLMLKTAK